MTMNDNYNLWLTEAMQQMNKKFNINMFNILNASAGSGKTNFIFNEFINNTSNYINTKQEFNLKNELNKIIYVCDTTMLKDSVLKDRENMTKVLEKNDLKNIRDNIKNNKIIVITYNTLGFLLKQKESRKIILKYIKVIVMDEIHNLFKYAYRFKDNENNYYNTILDNMATLVNNILVIGMTATPYAMYYPLSMLNTSYMTIFNSHELQKIKSFKNKQDIICKNMTNYIKWIALNYDNIKSKQQKILIYTNTISVANKYKNILLNGGYNVEYLCSNNNNTTKEQKQLREYIINNNDYPSELDILIINGAYETGWNLKDDSVNIVLIDSVKYDIQIQARSRIRHDIDLFIHSEIIDNDGIVYELDKYKQLIPIYDLNAFYPILIIHLDIKYINKKLTKEDKQKLIYKYGLIHMDKKQATFKTLKADILKYTNYKVVTCNKGTYIINKDDDIKEIIKKEKDENKMNNDNELLNYLESINNIKLYKDKQKELIDKINLKINGRLQKSYNKLNQGLSMLNLPFIIIPKKSDDKRYWIIEKIEE